MEEDGYFLGTPCAALQSMFKLFEASRDQLLLIKPEGDRVAVADDNFVVSVFATWLDAARRKGEGARFHLSPHQPSFEA